MTLYGGKCDKCGQERPEFYVQVNKTTSGVHKCSFGVWNVSGVNHSKVMNKSLKQICIEADRILARIMAYQWVKARPQDFYQQQ